mmetsp:Transcript_5112/g.10614  ORF Transcript_5112/g.10614 Transcript_5112/m.10614 type:complete len:158 (+) Transcript_5112:122-595(+)
MRQDTESETRYQPELLSFSLLLFASLFSFSLSLSFSVCQSMEGAISPPVPAVPFGDCGGRKRVSASLPTLARKLTSVGASFSVHFCSANQPHAVEEDSFLPLGLVCSSFPSSSSSSSFTSLACLVSRRALRFQRRLLTSSNLEENTPRRLNFQLPSW